MFYLSIQLMDIQFFQFWAIVNNAPRKVDPKVCMAACFG